MNVVEDGISFWLGGGRYYIMFLLPTESVFHTHVLLLNLVFLILVLCAGHVLYYVGFCICVKFHLLDLSCSFYPIVVFLDLLLSNILSILPKFDSSVNFTSVPSMSKFK